MAVRNVTHLSFIVTYGLFGTTQPFILRWSQKIAVIVLDIVCTHTIKIIALLNSPKDEWNIESVCVSECSTFEICRSSHSALNECDFDLVLSLTFSTKSTHRVSTHCRRTHLFSVLFCWTLQLFWPQILIIMFCETKIRCISLWKLVFKCDISWEKCF